VPHLLSHYTTYHSFIYRYDYSLSFFIFFYINIIHCEGLSDPPSIMEFRDLHLTENLSNAAKNLRKASGILYYTF